VKPSDFVDDDTAGLEDHLDKLGYVLLQKPVAGARPSRWIEPGLMVEALRHLDAVAARPVCARLMVERTNALDALGVAREGADWARTVTQPLALSLHRCARAGRVPACPLTPCRSGTSTAAAT